MWFAAAAASVAVVAEEYRSLESYRRSGERSLNYLADLHGLNKALGKGLVAKRGCSKCPSCGSREFRHHNMVRICSYCRSEA